MGNRTHFSLDYYLSYYEDFFSPPTIITPLVVNRFDGNGNEVTVHNLGDVAGLMPINGFGTHPPYGTAWNGLDDDGDWAEWADEFGWGDSPDHGEWGGVLLPDASGTPKVYTWGGKTYQSGDYFHPYEVLIEGDGYPLWNPIFNEQVRGLWEAVGVDELHSNTGLNECEIVQTGLIDSNGDPLTSDHGNASDIEDLVLSPMN